MSCGVCAQTGVLWMPLLWLTAKAGDNFHPGFGQCSNAFLCPRLLSFCESEELWSLHAVLEICCSLRGDTGPTLAPLSSLPCSENPQTLVTSQGTVQLTGQNHLCLCSLEALVGEALLLSPLAGLSGRPPWLTPSQELLLPENTPEYPGLSLSSIHSYQGPGKHYTQPRPCPHHRAEPSVPGSVFCGAKTWWRWQGWKQDHKCARSDISG